MHAVYPGPLRAYQQDGVSFIRGVPSWVKRLESAKGPTELVRWSPGETAAAGPPIYLLTGNDPDLLPAASGAALRIRECFPTCPLVVQGPVELVDILASVPDVDVRTSSSSSNRREWYREFNARRSSLAYWLAEQHLMVHNAQNQMIRGLGLWGGEEPENYRFLSPPRQPGTCLALLVGPDGDPDFASRMEAEISRRGWEVATARTVSDLKVAAAVVSVGYHPLLHSARALGVPVRALLPKGMSPVTLSQWESDAVGRRSSFAFGWLVDAQVVSLSSAVDSILAGMEAPGGRIGGHREIQGRTRNRHDRRQEVDEPTSEADAPRDESGGNHASG